MSGLLRSWCYRVGGGVNAVRFLTREEAERAGRELLSRWLLYDTFEVEQSEDPANYTFPEQLVRPEPLARP